MTDTSSNLGWSDKTAAELKYGKGSSEEPITEIIITRVEKNTLRDVISNFGLVKKRKSKGASNSSQNSK